MFDINFIAYAISFNLVFIPDTMSIDKKSDDKLFKTNEFP